MMMRTVLRALGVRLDPEETRGAFVAASILLRYPDEHLIESLDSLRTLSSQLPQNFGKPYVKMCNYLSAKGLTR